MGKVGSISIQAALASVESTPSIPMVCRRARSTRPSPSCWKRTCRFTSPRTTLRRHIQQVAIQMLIRWYQRHKQYKGRRLKIITLTRDPITHYPSGFLQRRDSVWPRVLAWHRARLNLHALDAIDEIEALSSFVLEVASIVVEGRPSTWPGAHQRCMALAAQRWPEHPVVAGEAGAWLGPLAWFEAEMAPIFNLDMLAGSELRDRGWAERSNEWADILVLKFEALSSLSTGDPTLLRSARAGVAARECHECQVRGYGGCGGDAPCIGYASGAGVHPRAAYIALWSGMWLRSAPVRKSATGTMTSPRGAPVIMVGSQGPYRNLGMTTPWA